MSPVQKAFQVNPDLRVGLPLYRFLREPTHFGDFDWERHRLMSTIWREYLTIICIWLCSIRQVSETRR